MRAADTNVVVRLLVGDDPRQMQHSLRLFSEPAVLVLNTVLLEAEWVLRAVYGLTAAQVHSTLTAFCEMTAVQLEDTDVVFDALAWLGQGLDFADALHLRQAMRHEADGFASYDKLLSRKVKKLKPAPAIAVGVP